MQLKVLAIFLIAAEIIGANDVLAKEGGSSVGVWVRNDKESFNLPHPVASERVIIRQDGAVLDYTWEGTDADGKKSSFSFKGPVDGKPQSVSGTFEGMKVATAPTLTQVNEGKIWEADGSSESKCCIRVSPDKLKCFATYIDEKGKESLFREVFDKEK